MEISYDGKTHRVRAGLEVVLSLGAIHTPKVLMQSGIGDQGELRRFGIPVVQLGMNENPFGPSPKAVQAARGYLEKIAPYPDDTGYFLKLLRYQAGYYLNVGASDLIIEQKIKLKSGVRIERLTTRTAIFSDGSSLDLDALVLAT